MTANPDIFLSYNREDQAVARLYADAFAAEGLNVWWDTALRSGEAYDEVTEAALRAAKAVVVLWSPRSVVSRWVRAEATIADRCKTLVPVMIEPCERPIMFELTQTADLCHWSGDAGDRAWLAFVSDVRRFVGREAEPDAVAVTPTVDVPAPVSERGSAPSLAVLPFTNRSGLSEDDVFAFGMVEDLIDALSLGVHARVLSSSSTARFRNGSSPDVGAMGRELGVRYLLEGNVRRSGNDLRVTAQLIEAAGGAILWTQKFDRPLTELAALQEQLIEEVAAHLGTQLLRREMEQALKKPSDVTAWECVMRALSALRTTNDKAILRAVEESARAVSIAPDYGLAHAMLADALGLAYMFRSPDDADEVRRIRHHIDRALSCDGENAAVLGYVASALHCIGQSPEGLRRAKRAIEINPGYGYVHLTAGTTSVMLGLPEAALAHFADFHRLEPNSPHQHYAWAFASYSHLLMGDLAAAEAAVDRSIAFVPENGVFYVHKALIVSQLGRTSEAQELMREARHRQPTDTRELWELRFPRWLPVGPALDAMLAALRKLWPATEGSA
ncbi:TIR domain-containing protein [Novosphingobium sp.]|uniref:TIR domain-containing protein n=1 Tax=Novosphingobium sp. TaxID=1874826 RepID=UPI00286B430A|nr:TIR domain-containing protein [Novosphingobium sp.]